MHYRIVLVLIFLFSFTIEMEAKDYYCQNLSFELGNFNNWQGFTWYNSTVSSVSSTLPAPGFGLQSIMSDTTAYDPNTNYQLKKIPTGFKYSARLGDLIANTQAASLRYTLTVDSSNAFLLYRFAVVFLNPLSGHTQPEEPRFKVSLMNQNGDTIHDCANYDVYTSEATLNASFNTYIPSGSTKPILWRNWTAVGVNLLPYIGQSVSIEFMASDCTHTGHYGYAYIVAECHPMKIAVKYCTGDSVATLIAPEGFESYNWKDSIGVSKAITKELKINSPKEGEVYTCDLTSATGCRVTLSSTINRYEPNADYNYETLDCNKITNTVRFFDNYSPKHGNYEYLWRFDDGTTSSQQNPVHTFVTSGLHKVSLVVKNPPSTCYDSVLKDVETFYPPLIRIQGDSTYCDGSTTTIKGVGAYRYKWSNGSTADSIKVGADSKIWMIGYSKLGCYTDTIYKIIKKAPDWDFNVEGKQYFCQGGFTYLKGTGAKYYIWNDSVKTDSLKIKKPGIIKVSGYNKYGCKIDKYLNVIEVILPDADFSVSPEFINKKHSNVSCVILHPKTNATYSWTFFEESQMTEEFGAVVNHKFNDFNISGEYVIKSHALDSYGCSGYSENKITSQPFFPNVFTPNNDGFNEKFLEGYDLKIFDRYGMLLYNGNDGWDGKFKGKVVPPDTYFYISEYSDYKSQPHVVKGTVTLLIK